jgi:hypothetical protein
MDNDEQEVPGNDEDNDDGPPNKKAKKANNQNSTYNERFGVCIQNL